MFDITQQLNLWDSIMPNYKIGKDKTVRLIELFSGIGSQYMALKVLAENDPDIKIESYKTCEWAYNSIVAYNSIHLKDKTDYSKGLTKEDLLAYLNGNISTDYNEPADLTKKSEEWLRNCYNNCKATHNLMNIMNVKGGDLEVKDTDKYEYIMTYSFPCQ